MANYAPNTYDIQFHIIKKKLEIISISDLNNLNDFSDVLTILKIYTTKVNWETNGSNRSDWSATIELLDNNGLPAEPLENNGWKFEIAHTCRCFYTVSTSNRCFKAKFIDVFGTESISEIFDISSSGFLRAYSRFLKLSTHKGYNVATLEIEKEELKEENHNLKQKIADLNVEIGKLKERISYLG